MSQSPENTPEQTLARLEQALRRGPISQEDLAELANFPHSPPRLDPDEPRRSALELRLIAHAMGSDLPVAPLPASGVDRAGYRLVGGGDDARAWPAFAAALGAEGDPRELFPELQAIDGDLWRLADVERGPALARRWLTSPGRRLLQDLSLLSLLGGDDQQDHSMFSAVDTTWERLMACARPVARRAATPGALRDEPLEFEASGALYALEQGDTALGRAAALRWLLDRAAQAPVVSIDGVRRDLREDLPVFFAMALEGGAPAAQVRRHALALEELCLAHAARIARAHQRSEDAEDTWHLARWIQATTFASPFFGGDRVVLAARLRALLKEPAPAAGTPPLAPARFGGGEGVDLEDFARAWGVGLHYARPPGLRPTPVQVAVTLRLIAQRPCRSGEREAERALNALGRGGAPLVHVAPPWLARKLLSEIQIPWLFSGPPEVWAEIGEALEDQAPARFRWLAGASFFEGDPQLAGPQQGRLISPDGPRAAAVLRNWRRGRLAEWEPRERAALAVGLIGVWEQDDAERAFQDIGESQALAPKLWNRVAECARQRVDPPGPAWSARAVAALTHLAREGTDLAARRAAIFFALQRAREQAPDALPEVLELAALPEFRDHVSLHREMGRLGLRI